MVDRIPSASRARDLAQKLERRRATSENIARHAATLEGKEKGEKIAKLIFLAVGILIIGSLVLAVVGVRNPVTQAIANAAQLVTQQTPAPTLQPPLAAVTVSATPAPTPPPVESSASAQATAPAVMAANASADAVAYEFLSRVREGDDAGAYALIADEAKGESAQLVSTKTFSEWAASVRQDGAFVIQLPVKTFADFPDEVVATLAFPNANPAYTRRLAFWVRPDLNGLPKIRGGFDANATTAFQTVHFLSLRVESLFDDLLARPLRDEYDPWTFEEGVQAGVSYFKNFNMVINVTSNNETALRPVTIGVALDAQSEQRYPTTGDIDGRAYFIDRPGSGTPWVQMEFFCYNKAYRLTVSPFTKESADAFSQLANSDLPGDKYLIAQFMRLCPKDPPQRD